MALNMYLKKLTLMINNKEKLIFDRSLLTMNMIIENGQSVKDSEY